MEQKILRLAKKLNKFTIDDLIMTLEENSADIQQKLDLLLETGQIIRAESGSYFYSEKNYRPEKNILTKENKYYRGMLFTDEELKKLDEEVQTSQAYKNSKNFIKKKINKYVALVKASNGIFGRSLVHFLKEDWNKKHPEMKCSKDFLVKARRLLKTYGIEGLIPVGNSFPKYSQVITENLYGNFKEYLYNNRGETLKSSYIKFKEEFIAANPDTDDSEFPSYRAFTERIQKDILETKDDYLSGIYQPRQKVELVERKKSGFTDFKSAATDFFQYLKEDRKLKKETIKRYNGYINVNMIPFFGKYRLDEITEELIEKYKAAKTEEQLSERNIWSQMFLLRRILTIYTPEKYIPPVKTSGKISYSINILDKIEIKKILRIAKENYYNEVYPLILTALLTGMTKGELLSLRWENIQWKNKKIKVKSTIIQGRIRTYRIENAIREVDVPEFLIAALSEWKDKCQQETDYLVFPDSEGEVQNPDRLIKRTLKAISKKTGIGEIRFIDLRDTYAAILIKQNFPVTYIQNQLGLSSVQATVDRYRSLIDKNKPATLNLPKEIFI